MVISDRLHRKAGRISSKVPTNITTLAVTAKCGRRMLHQVDTGAGQIESNATCGLRIGALNPAPRLKASAKAILPVQHRFLRSQSPGHFAGAVRTWPTLPRESKGARGLMIGPKSIYVRSQDYFFEKGCHHFLIH